MRNVATERRIEILLVEDSPPDARLTLEAFKDAAQENHLWIVDDGVEALDFLYRRHAHVDAPRPDIVLLDLNLPRMDGREVLRCIKADRSLRQIPVVVLTTSASEKDVLEVYDLHANCYVTKPVDFAEFREMVRTIEEFWLTVVRLPSEAS